jgi:hypothetical protein
MPQPHQEIGRDFGQIPAARRIEKQIDDQEDLERQPL